MSYILKKSSGSTLLILNDGMVDKSATSLTLIGKNVISYGDSQNENFLYLLENFASSTEPRSPTQGQLWFDTNSNVFRPAVFDGFNWRPLAISVIGQSPTDSLINGSGYNFAANQLGDFWFDSLNKQLHVITSTSSDTTLIGPEIVNGFGTTKMYSTKMFDNQGTAYPVIQIILDNEIIGILSSFSFISSLSNNVLGFSKVNRGLTFKNYNSSTRYTTSTSDVIFSGLHEQLDQSYPRRNINEHIQANWCFDDLQLLNFGTNYNSSVGWNSNSLSFVSSGTITLQNELSNITFIGQTINPSAGINLGTSSTIFNSLYISTLSSGDINLVGNIEGNWKLTTGNLTLNADPTENFHAATKHYVDNQALYVTLATNNKVDKSGDIMTGPLTLNADPTANLQAATKQYVDNIGSSNSLSSNSKVSKSGDIMTGPLTLNADPTANLQAATKQYVDNIGSSNFLSSNNKVDKSGDTMTGPLTLNADPTANLQAATKQYVDNSEARIIPRGIISMWSGSLQTIPYGWQLCDGTNGTPNLIDRFIVGAGRSYSTGQTGGSNSTFTDSAGSHNHGGASASHQLTIDELPAHSHSLNDPGHSHSSVVIGSFAPGRYGPDSIPAPVAGTTGKETTGITINNTGGNSGHTHNISTEGSHNHSVTVTPYYYSLAYIMKL